MACKIKKKSDTLAYLVPIPVGRDASVGDTHAEASYTSELIRRGQIKGVRLTLIASQSRCVLLQLKIRNGQRIDGELFSIVKL